MSLGNHVPQGGHAVAPGRRRYGHLLLLQQHRLLMMIGLLTPEAPGQRHTALELHVVQLGQLSAALGVDHRLRLLDHAIQLKLC